MIHLLKRFFDDIHRLANFVTANPMQDMLVSLSQEDRDLLSKYRRYAPRDKKETRESTNSADGWIGRSGDVG